MKIIFLILFIFLNIYSEDVGLSNPLNVKVFINETSWLLIEYNNKGTRSEGQNGKLFIDGKEKIGKLNDEFKINEISFKHYGVIKEQLWIITGWNYSDPRKVKYSWLADDK